MKYRPDIDGLRAVAILLVVICHSQLGFPGGFVGVDVFFVLSGFLISKVTIHQIEQGKFSFRRFWTRRIRRLAPALLASLTFTWIGGWLILLPQHFCDLGRAILSQLFCLSNVYSWMTEPKGYFAPGPEVHPALHNWSLAVEEQFYLLFSLALVFILLRRCRWKLAAVVLATLSLCASCFAVGRIPHAVFYLTPFRIWELLLGTSVIALSARTTRRAAVDQVLSAMGLTLIVGSACVYSSATPFPGAAALCPAIGTALLLYSNESERTSIGRLLSIPPIVFIGKISYSLYLWHWPIMAFGAYAWGNWPSPRGESVLVMLSLAAATVSFYLIEKPFRFGPRFESPRRLWVACSLWIFLLAGLSVLSIASGGEPGRYSPLTLRLIATAAVPEPEPSLSGDLGLVRKLGSTGKPVSFLLWGDSHAKVLANVFDRSAKELGKSGLLVTHAATSPLLNVRHWAGSGLKPADQQRWAKAVLELVRRDKISSVFLGGYWKMHTYYNPELSENLQSTVEALRGCGARVFVIKDVPFPPTQLPRALALRLRYGLDVSHLGPTLADEEHRSAGMSKILLKLGQQVTVLDPRSFFVDGSDRYQVFDDNAMYYVDDNHVSEAASYRLEPMVRQALSGED